MWLWSPTTPAWWPLNPQISAGASKTPAVSVKVTKNKLAQLALKDTDAEKLSDLMTGPTILAFSKDPIAAAKAAVTYAKGNDKLVILGGAMGKTILDAKGVQALAELPSA